MSEFIVGFWSVLIVLFFVGAIKQVYEEATVEYANHVTGAVILFICLLMEWSILHLYYN